MRSLFLFLVLLNILYGLWQLQGGIAERTLYESADRALDQMPAFDPRPADAPDGRASAVEVPSPTILCVNLGVFPSASSAEQLRQRLLALSIQSAVISRDVPGSQDFLLVLPVQGGQYEALRILGQLQEQGIDSFLITQGALQNQISLGVFSREDYARARQAQLDAMGFEVRVEVQQKSAAEFVVQVDSGARRLVDQALLSRLRESFPGLQHQFHRCKAVAN